MVDTLCTALKFILDQSDLNLFKHVGILASDKYIYILLCENTYLPFLPAVLAPG